MLTLRKLIRLTPMLVALFMLPAVSCANEPALPGDERTPDRYGISLELGNTYDPGHDISFGLITGFGLFDYGKVWRQDRPKELCFKVEGALGTTFRPDARTVASMGMMALYYLDRVATPQLRPYLEGGIGIIYTDFRVEGQGLRFNFNPQLGIGAELQQKDLPISFVTLRLHHLSNGDLYHDNRGVNSLVLQVGRFF
jgi:hypothetical protein